MLQYHLMHARTAGADRHKRPAPPVTPPRNRGGAPPGRVGLRAVTATVLAGLARRLDADRAWRALL